MNARRWLGLAASLWLAAANAPALDADEPRARALLIAVEQYDPSWGWTPLTGPKRDALAVRSALLERGGFRAEDIALLLDEQATRQGILDALDELATSAGPGDLLLVFYAGHGSQVPDDDGDELDGWDETLVPIDAVGPDGQPNDVRDDDLAAFIARANEHTDNVALVFDCCASGTNVRGSGAMVSRYVRPELRGFAGVRESETQAPGPGPGASYDFADERSYVSLSACRATQSAFELPVEDADGTVTHGLFTWSLVQELYDLAPETSYGDLLQRVRRRVAGEAPDQTPVIEGSLQRRLLFGGRSVSQEPFYALTEKGGQWFVDGGTAVGLGSGAQLTVCDGKAASAATSEPLGRVRVEQTGALRSRVAWVEGGAAASADEGPLRAFPDRYRRLTHPLSLRLEGHDDARGRLADRLRSRGAVRVEAGGTPDIVVSLGPAGHWSARTAEGLTLPLGADAGEQAEVELLIARLESLGRAHDLARGLASVPDQLPVTWKLVHEDEGDVAVDLPAATGAEAAPSLAVDDRIKMLVRNDGDRPVWVALLVIAPDGEVQQIWSSPEDDPLPPGVQLTSPTWNLHVGDGAEPFYRADTQRFVGLASRRPLDLTRLAQPPVTDLVIHRGGEPGQGAVAAELPFERGKPIGVTIFDVRILP